MGWRGGEPEGAGGRAPARQEEGSEQADENGTTGHGNLPFWPTATA